MWRWGVQTCPQHGQLALELLQTWTGLGLKFSSIPDSCKVALGSKVELESEEPTNGGSLSLLFPKDRYKRFQFPLLVACIPLNWVLFFFLCMKYRHFQRTSSFCKGITERPQATIGWGEKNNLLSPTLNIPKASGYLGEPMISYIRMIKYQPINQLFTKIHQSYTGLSETRVYAPDGHLDKETYDNQTRPTIISSWLCISDQISI